MIIFMTWEHGQAVLKDALTTLPNGPGVYRMLNTEGAVLYVGKAKNLKRRVTSYTQRNRLTIRIQRMVAQTDRLEVIRTRSEVEALLLEANLIKKHLPPFNILLRDDKSFPYILLTTDHAFPGIAKHRGSKKRKGEYYGPFADSRAVNRSLITLQKAFLLRNCTDSMFNSRTRPCLQYQIKRCTAPCVGRVTAAEYAEQIAQAQAFLSGKSATIQAELAQKMEEAATRLDYETAAKYRDRIRALTRVQSAQDINLSISGDTDVIALAQEGGTTCIQVFFFRAGSNYGNRTYFPRHDAQTETADVLGAFITQFYHTHPPPRTVLLSHTATDTDLITEALSQTAKQKVTVTVPQRGDKRKAIDHALFNAREALARALADRKAQGKLLAGVAEAFGMPGPPERIEIYDNSHISGTHAVGSMVVAGPEGLQKKHYRVFNIRNEDVMGDDFGMMREVIRRRFSGTQAKSTPPDLMLIDGGIGQLNAVLQVMADVGVTGVTVVGISKGPQRNAGRETFHMAGHMAERTAFQMEPDTPVLHYLQRLRDEAHRTAIGSHRARRAKAIAASPLDDIAGIGPKRKKALLHHFGSARAVAGATVPDLLAVDGINAATAQAIYDAFHGA